MKISKTKAPFNKIIFNTSFKAGYITVCKDMIDINKIGRYIIGIDFLFFCILDYEFVDSKNFYTINIKKNDYTITG